MLIATALAVVAAVIIPYGVFPGETEERKKAIEYARLPKTFSGGDQGFLDLKLSSVANVNHNVKRFRFELPKEDAVSGLNVACQ